MSTYISRGSESEKGGCDADDGPAAGNYVVYQKALHCNYYRSLHRALCVDFIKEERCSFYIDYLGEDLGIVVPLLIEQHGRSHECVFISCDAQSVRWQICQ